MNLPIEIAFNTETLAGHAKRKIVLHRGLTVLIGPNGAGKTQLLRSLKSVMAQHTAGKLVRYLSAGRISIFEQYRSDINGYGGVNYDQATFGNKNDSSRRHNFESLSGDFYTLADRPDILIKVQERLRKLFKRDVLMEWDGGLLKPQFARLDRESKPYASSREASGLLHLIGLLAALYDDEVGALLIDEPEVSLHPQLQAFLLAEILHVAGVPSAGNNKKLVIIATHSTEMVQISRVEDLLSLVFCYDREAEPVQIPANAGELQAKKVTGLVARLGQEHKLSLFSKRPLLVEGPSDVIVCSALESKADASLEAAGSQLLPVIGKGQMPVVAKLLRLMGKDPVVLADADGFADGIDLVTGFLNGSDAADISAAAMGADSALSLAKSIYSDFCKVVEEKWDDAAVFAENHPYWVNRKKDDDVAISKRRAFFSTLFSLNNEQISGFDATGKCLTMRKRLEALLSLLEHTGCFFLRRGSIESYYETSSQCTTQEKPTAAADEMEHIAEISVAAAESAYADILRCIRHASNAAPISESEALRDLLLAAAAPAFVKFKSGGSAQDVTTTARMVLGDRSKLFEMSVIGDKLRIDVTSEVLDVSCFPLTIDKTDDIVKVVTAALA
ncbi:hypothetical protein NLI96_g12989 [Meripilus lineatus]|uniref:AAA+ ATPase domain-containing protein n=1 Tax=Meripilus lineatus TaxID=2056292 RepID=A0AAD5UNU0_9APHY|nr:hypothetical protein NLI96_g12989 [Physisporinus lineatus]